MFYYIITVFGLLFIGSYYKQCSANVPDDDSDSDVSVPIDTSSESEYEDYKHS
jgi:hypothetical protein